MKPESSGPRRPGDERRKVSVAMSGLPMEWMDPMSWRLPSGKALAEFALQAGFLAPLILSGPRVAKKNAKTPHERVPGTGSAAAVAKEVPEQSGTFRGTR